MKTIRIKTFNLNSQLDSHHFFILSKGYNAGKPMDKPCPNCFIVTAENEEHKYQLFWICYSLWKSGAYLPLLCGSVIPFLHIRDAEAQIEKALENVSSRRADFEKNIFQLQQLIRTEKLLGLQLKLIDEIKRSISVKLTSSKDSIKF
jgi:hypothetical protein